MATQGDVVTVVQACRWAGVREIGKLPFSKADRLIAVSVVKEL